MAQHSGLTVERWKAFSRDQQIIMIANEMHRASKLLEATHRDLRRNCYERVLALTDLTIAVLTERNLRFELLRWRDLVAELFLSETARPEQHFAVLRVLLLFTPEAAKQRRFAGV
jgi:hypothetical protein